MASARAPLLIIGSHRSGTTMLVELLEQFGYFSGWKRDEHLEATFFIKLNSWLLSQAGGSWILPNSIKYFYESELAVEMSADFLTDMLRSPRRLEFTGWKRFFEYRSIADFDFPWGWKTPPSCFTLPIWLRLFPNAKVIHILRHGIDVAASHKAFPDAVNDPVGARENYRKKKWYYLLKGGKEGGFVANLRCSSFDGSFTLWEEYAAEARKQINQLGSRGIEIRYEDFLARPAETLAQLLTFGEIPFDPKQVETACKDVKASRAFAYRKVPELLAMESKYRDRLARYFY